MKYGITGATGHFGLYAIQTLRKIVGNENIVALARNLDKAKQTIPSGIEIRSGNYDDKDQLTESLNGIDRLLFISSLPGQKISRLDQHKNVVNAAKDAGVKFIAYTSFPHADSSKEPFAQDHKETEKVIKNSGIAHSFLRNNWYLQNELGTIKPALNGQDFNYAGDDGKVGWALESEYAEGAINVLTNDDPKEVYEFCGQPRTYAQLANTVKKATGKDFNVNSMSLDQYKDSLKQAGMDDATIGALNTFQSLIRNGALDEDSNDLPNVLGHSLTPLDKAINNILK